MDYYDKEFCLEVWGPMACFTRPELKVERVSYDVITPSAARAIFEAIFWKPAIRWQVCKIEVLNPIKWGSIRRNEVGALAGKFPIYIEEKRQQKNTLLLLDVHYRITARLVFIPPKKREGDHHFGDLERMDENPGKYNAIFERRASKGQCFNQPYFGTRECIASFRLVDPKEEVLDNPIPEDRDFGLMLYDMDFSKSRTKPDAMFYHARMQKGIIHVPPIDSEEILK